MALSVRRISTVSSHYKITPRACFSPPLGFPPQGDENPPSSLTRAVKSLCAPLHQSLRSISPFFSSFLIFFHSHFSSHTPPPPPHCSLPFQIPLFPILITSLSLCMRASSPSPSPPPHLRYFHSSPPSLCLICSAAERSRPCCLSSK